MISFFPSEVFREISFDSDDFKKQKRYAISNFGRIVSFTLNIHEGRILKGSLTEGFRVLRLKNYINGKVQHQHIMVSRLIADEFIEKPTPEHKYLLHLDYNKSNDHVDNLKWATEEERKIHLSKNPAICNRPPKAPRQDGHKLSSTQVIRIKKMLANPNRKTRLKLIAKQFGISEMQLYRIKSGENWSHVKI